MNTFVINNSNFNGNNISIVNNKIYIDGKDVTPDAKEINITVTGNIEELNVDCCAKVQINGDVGSVETQSGNVNCGNVKKNIKTMSGNVRCKDIEGDVETMSGDVNANNITGNCSTISGDINK